MDQLEEIKQWKIWGGAEAPLLPWHHKISGDLGDLGVQRWNKTKDANIVLVADFAKSRLAAKATSALTHIDPWSRRQDSVLLCWTSSSDIDPTGGTPWG